MKTNALIVVAVALSIVLAGCGDQESTQPDGSVPQTAAPLPEPSSIEGGAYEEPDYEGPKVLPYGQADEGDSWTIQVDGVDSSPQADARVRADEYLFDPSPSMQYVIATVTAQNTSAVRQDPSSLSSAFSLAGSDLLVYEAQIFLSLDNALDSQPETLPGGVVTGTIVFEIPPGTIGNGDISALSGKTRMLTTWSADPDAPIVDP